MRSLATICIVFALMDHSVLADETATVLTANATVPTIEDIRATACDCTVTEEAKGAVRLIHCNWPEVSVTVRIDPDYNYAPQVTGLQGWFARAMKKYEPSPERLHAEKLIPSLRQSYTCTVVPSFDESGVAFGFVTRLATKLDGLIFSHRSLYTNRGIHIVGRQAAPDLLGPVGARSLATDGSPLELTEEHLRGKWSFVFMWEVEDLTAILTGEDKYSDNGLYDSTGTLLYLVDDMAVAQFTYTDSGQWKVDGQAFFVKSLKREVLSARGGEGFPVEEMRSQLLQPDTDFERSVVVQHGDNILYDQSANGVVWMKRVDETEEPESRAYAKPLVEMSPEELGGDPTSSNTEVPDPVGEQIRTKSMAAARAAGFQPATWLPTAGHRSGVPGECRDSVGVRNRFLALYVLVNWVTATEEKMSSADLKALIRRFHLKKSLIRQEREILKMSREDARREYRDTIGWKLENMWALAWVLGFDTAPSIETGQVSDKIIRPMFKFADDLSGKDDTAVQNGMRDERVIKELEDLFYCTHNAVRSAQTGDASAVPKGFHSIREGGATHERRHALTWVLSPGVDWDDVDLST